MNTLDSQFTSRQVLMPSYDVSAVQTGIVHIGLGAFHRGHQALFTDEYMSSTGDTQWGVASANVFAGQELVEQLKDQDNRYTVTEMNADGSRTVKLCAAIHDALAVAEDRRPLLELMVKESTKIVSLTITEKGYCLNPADGKLLTDTPMIANDLENIDHPHSAIGIIVAGLIRRREAGIQPFTVLSCDNMPHNGKRIQEAVIQFAEHLDSDLAQWISANVCFPSTMVDRIVPAVTEQDLEQVRENLGVQDNCAIVTEAFRQWVIEDNFTMGRPDWDKVEGASFVADVAPYEDMKLRMLNGSHSILAYLGYLGSYPTISEVTSDPDYYKVARHYMLEEAAATLDMPEGTDVIAYADLLLERFLNPGLQHRTWQIAMDGSQKIIQRWLNGARILLAEERSFDCIAMGVAGWIRYAGAVDEQGNSIDVRDPMAEKLKATADQHRDNPEEMVRAFLDIEAVFGEDLASNDRFVKAVTHSYQNLIENGAKACVAELATKLTSR